MLIKFSFIATPNMKQLFCVIRLLFMIFLVLVVVRITLAKQKKLYEEKINFGWIHNNSVVYKAVCKQRCYYQSKYD